MKRPITPVLLVLLASSLALNAGFLVDHVRRGTFRRLFVRMDLAEAPPSMTAFQAEMEARYRKLPESSGGVVFAGDSLIYLGPWAEFYSSIHNRGISNETSALLLARLGEVIRGKPRTLVLLTGANDLIQAVPVPQLVRNYRAILDKVRAESPTTEVAVLGLLPVVPGGPRYDNPAVIEANRQVEALVREFPGVRFLDLTNSLTEASGTLRRAFTEDGLHLNLDGYLAVREAVRGLIEGPRSAVQSPMYSR